MAWLAKPLFEIGDVSVTSTALIRFLVIVLIAWWLSKFVQLAIGRLAAGRPGVNHPHRLTGLGND